MLNFLVLCTPVPVVILSVCKPQCLIMFKSREGSPESVDMTIKELEEILKEGVVAEGGSSGNMARAKVVGIACDVCKPDDVRKLANFAVSELGSIDIWVSNLDYRIELYNSGLGFFWLIYRIVTYDVFGGKKSLFQRGK